MRDGEAGRECFRLVLVAARNAGDDAVFRVLDRRDDEFAADLGGRYDSEAQHGVSPLKVFPIGRELMHVAQSVSAAIKRAHCP